MIANFGVAWLLTYLLHSTLFLGVAWLASRRLARWSAHAEEAAWRFALVAALVTASLQLAAGWEPLAGSWGLPSASAAPAAETSAPAPLAPRSPKATVFATAPVRTPEPLVARTTEAPVVRVSLPGVVLGVWALGALLLIARCAHSFVRLGRHLKDRPRVVGGTLYTQLDRLSGEVSLDGPIRLTSSSRLPVPIALGLRTREICVPPRALVGLTAEQQEGMLAHELAHLARRDPFWLLFSHILSSVFFFQPLNWVARRRLREISELLSDEWAVRRTGRPVSLARCLAEVAGWSVRSLEALPTPGMADRPSHLAHRIRRLLDEARSPERPARRLWLGAAMLALLVAVAAAAPVVSAAAKQHEETPAIEAVVAEAVEPQEPREPEEAIEAEEPEEAEEAEHEHHHDYGHDDDSDDDHDSDYDVETDFEIDSAFDFSHEADFDFDFDFELHEEQLEAITEAATQIADATLESLSMDLGGLDGLDELGELNDAELHHLEQEIDRATDEIEKSLQPEMERLERVIEQRTEAISKRMTSPELERLRGEMERMGERMRPSDEEMDRLHAEAEKLRADGGLSADERARLRSEARRLSEQSRPSAEERKAMQELAKKYREETRRVMGEHRGEIEAMRRDIDQESRALRDQMRQRMKDNPRLREIERKDRERVREEVRREHDKHRSEADRHREHIRKESRERIRERPEPKPRPEPRPRVKVEVDPKVEVEVEVEAGSGSF